MCRLCSTPLPCSFFFAHSHSSCFFLFIVAAVQTSTLTTSPTTTPTSSRTTSPSTTPTTSLTTTPTTTAEYPRFQCTDYNNFYVAKDTVCAAQASFLNKLLAKCYAGAGDAPKVSCASVADQCVRVWQRTARPMLRAERVCSMCVRVAGTTALHRGACNGICCVTPAVPKPEPRGDQKLAFCRPRAKPAETLATTHRSRARR